MLSESWSAVTKAAIAEAVLALTKMDEERRNSAICLTTPSLWLALAALCLLQEEHVDRLSSAQWANPRGAVSKVLELVSGLRADDYRSVYVVRCSRFALITMMERRLHRSSVRNADRCAWIATGSSTCLSASTRTSGRCARKRKKPSKWTFTKDADASNFSGSWPCPKRGISSR